MRLQKIIIGFALIDGAHTGENIAHAILNVVSEFGLTDKIFTVTLDNASSNTTTMESLSPLFPVYAASFLLHQRYACHIIILLLNVPSNANHILKNCKLQFLILVTLNNELQAPRDIALL